MVFTNRGFTWNHLSNAPYPSNPLPSFSLTYTFNIHIMIMMMMMIDCGFGFSRQNFSV